MGLSCGAGPCSQALQVCFVRGIGPPCSHAKDLACNAPVSERFLGSHRASQRASTDPHERPTDWSWNRANPDLAKRAGRARAMGPNCLTTSSAPLALQASPPQAERRSCLTPTLSIDEPHTKLRRELCCSGVSSCLSEPPRGVSPTLASQAHGATLAHHFLHGRAKTSVASSCLRKLPRGVGPVQPAKWPRAGQRRAGCLGGSLRAPASGDVISTWPRDHTASGGVIPPSHPASGDIARASPQMVLARVASLGVTSPGLTLPKGNPEPTRPLAHRSFSSCECSKLA
jgi:hypothetical protein